MEEAETTHGSDAPVGSDAPATEHAPASEHATQAADAPESGDASADAASSEGGAPPEASAAPDGEAAPEAAEPVETVAAAPRLNLSWDHVRGFQSLENPGLPEGVDAETYAAEFAKELEARAERFRQSVDDSIVLASDGVIRWLGDPVGRLIGGDDILKPRAVLLADEALQGESRAAVEARLGLWVAAHVRKVLGPLEALAEPGPEVPEAAREIARRVAEALGVLERERVRNQVKGLDQNARAALRKLGLRFGASYIFVPALLKPAPRMLSMQLWSLRRGVEAGADRLLSFASAGRTSFANEGTLSPDAYRVAGFRLCGERVVRVDIVERLTDLIRAAMPNHMRPGEGGEASGFLVTPQMTSLTGCAGEAFAAILRSLGYESHKVKKADFEAATRKAPAAQAPAPAASAETPAVAEAEPQESADSSAAEPTEAPAEGEASEAHPPEIETVAEAAPEAPVPPAEEPPAEAAAPEPVEALVETAVEPEPASEPVDAVAGDPAPAAASAEPVSHEEAPAEPAVAEASPADPAEEEWVEVWRLAPRRRPPPPRPQAQRPEGQSRPAWRGRDSRPSQPAKPVAEEPAEAAPVSESAPPREDRRPHGHSRRDGGKERSFKGPPREDRGDRGPKPDRGGPPRKDNRPVDMDSPFAKLLALKPLLSRRDERT